MTSRRTAHPPTPVRVAALVAGLAALTVLTGCGSSDSGDSAASGSGDLTPLTLQTSWIPLVQFGGSYVADKEGYYADHGVDVDILPGGPEVDSMARVSGPRSRIWFAPSVMIPS